MNKKQLSTIAVGIIAATQAQGAGFQVAEHSATGLGRAYSGEAAIADNASTLARNPANMMLLEKRQVSGAIHIVDPHIRIKDKTNNEEAKDVAPVKAVPAFYFVSPQTDKWSWGIGLYTTYGVATDYPDDLQIGDIAGHTDLLTTNLNPALAYQVNDKWSVGVGLSLVYAKAELTRYKGALAAGLGGDKRDNLLSLKGDAVGYGFNVGTTYHFNDDHRIGFGYRSEVALEFEDGDLNSYDTGISTPPKVDGDLELDLPEIYEVSGFHQLTDDFAMHYSWKRTGWRSFKELKATSSQCNNGTPNQCFYKDEQYKDNVRLSLGGTYQFNDAWTGRAGIAFDEKAGKATLSIPDSDRYWYSTGFTYQYNADLTIDAAITWIRSRDGNFKETNGLGQDIEISSKGDAYLSAVQLNYTF
ncbi:long-chain fatty acid transporter [Salinivibrio sp. SS3]|uniref:outer membrane protein transport protein n=1 Tax=Salinivibrio TaxID=51366 RepID=UPI000847F337|nr:MULTISPECIES: outer membrane protein transport protein [Salinivibrio]ODP98835.1 long-chain fatty acid transporter [Salinivibrio sp. BNH]OOE71376.1 long-chain fatty acid transporter [Salinivibrio kushneri]